MLWFPILVPLFEGLLGVDLWGIVGAIAGKEPSFYARLVANVLFGVGVALLFVLAGNRYADRSDHAPAIRRILDGFAGRELTGALTTSTRSVDSKRSDGALRNRASGKRRCVA